MAGILWSAGSGNGKRDQEHEGLGRKHGENNKSSSKDASLQSGAIDALSAAGSAEPWG